MKGQETDYLDKLFASSSDVTDEAEVEVPLVDVPKSLGGKLYAIADSAPIGVASEYGVTVKRSFFQSWPKVTSIAASLFVAIVGFQFYQQQQALTQLEQAQTDLATALYYLGEANRITRAEVLNSLNENMNKAGVVPAMEIGRDTVTPDFKKPAPVPKKLNRTL